MKLSVVISTYNRAQSLRRTLESIKGLASQIIIVDNESPDNTKAVAKEYKATVFTRPNSPVLNINKNYGIAKANGDWILCLDDDEVVTVELAQEIKNVISHTTLAGFWIPRKNIIFGKWIEHGIWWPDPQLRLFKRSVGKYPQKHVHEHIVIDGPTGNLTASLTHYNYDSINQYISKMQSIYTDSEVNAHVASGYKLVWFDALRFPVSDFVKLYFAQSGYKDGLHGLVLALLQAFYSFIVFAKLWEREKFVEIETPQAQVRKELGRAKNDITYWTLTQKIRTTKDPLLVALLKLRRKLTRI